MVRTTLALLTVFLSIPTQARDLEGKYAQADPALKRWFNDQKIPGSGASCCSQADGITAEEDIRNGDYWVRFEANGVLLNWMKVPKEAVLNTPNLRGVPVVWWTITDETSGAATVIRCYSPGPKS